MLRPLLFLIVLALTGPVSAGSLIVLGDSLSAAYKMAPEQGWVALLEKRLQQEGYDVSVTNASVSGDTTQNGIARLKPLLAQNTPDIVVIELGGNDGLRGMPPLLIRRNLQKLIDMAEDAGAQVLLLGIQIPTNYGPAYTRQFTSIYPDLAEDNDIPLVPFFLQGVALKPELMQQDGIHPNADAQPYLVDAVWPHLTPLLD
ncbi:arylesterase [Neptuniibacter sp. CAU 1671]|uniref:arylesterase n=1 Tax=Neptuniibacter sp. CAU 1671 TaxID=3032593 RepID=UPI0023DB8D79|nr:arylesterase [Neptuniibacter sp. CAU 1671]MDF2182620.1 arylesterase [Neptuniibacter sp. CAU 1671]